MRRIVTVALATAGMIAPLALVPTAAANPVPAPPFVDHVEWAKWGDLSSLRVYPTQSGRQASGLSSAVNPDDGWAEVLTLSPDADIPGMREQFVCHWEFAEFSEPGKSSWNLEPWRPLVSEQNLLEAGCNPGGTEEPF